MVCNVSLVTLLSVFRCTSEMAVESFNKNWDSDLQSPASIPLVQEMSNIQHHSHVERSKTKKTNKHKLFYGVEDIPAWSTTILFGIQQVLVCASGVVATPLVVAELLCAGGNSLARVKLIATLMFVTGFSTIIQSTFGVRLPLLQGPSFAFLPPIIALMDLPIHKCHSGNITVLTDNATTFHAGDENEEWMGKMQIVQGGLITAAIIEMIIGSTGLIGFITRHVGPLTIAPLMLLLEFSAINMCLNYATQHWMAAVMLLFLIIVSLYLHLVPVPLPTISNRKCTTIKFPLFAVFPYLIAISLIWLLCVLLTITDVFNMENHRAVRTDIRAQVISEAPWFHWPYPFQWGLPKFNVGVVLGMIAGTTASILESVGDYHACARACDAPPPPLHAVNRGILAEGLCCLIGGTLGGGVGVTTYSENVGVIGITKVASRRTMQMAGVLFLLLGVFTKVGAVLATIPDPLVGGILIVSCAMVGGVGLSSVQLLDLTLSRNSAILGFSIMLGVLVPEYFKRVPIKTGNDTADQVLTILLSMQMFVGGVIGFILDNTIPGASRQQRGLAPTECNEENGTDEKGQTRDVYQLPPRFIKWIKKCRLSFYLPFLPTFGYRSN